MTPTRLAALTRGRSAAALVSIGLLPTAAERLQAPSSTSRGGESVDRNRVITAP